MRFVGLVARSKAVSSYLPWTRVVVNRNRSSPLQDLPREIPANPKDLHAPFVAAFHQLTETGLGVLKEDLKEIGGVAPQEEAINYYRKCIMHSVQGGKMTRGLTVLFALKCFGVTDPTVIRRGFVMGWLVEWLQAFFLVMDDVMDNSVTRRNRPCWFRMDGVTATNAINDSVFLENFMYVILQEYLHDCPELRLHTYDLLHESSMQTILGQHLDTNTTIPGSKMDPSRYTMDRFRSIVIYKTAYYSFYLPCALGMQLAERTDEALLEQCRQICLKMGEYFQATDDYLDCFQCPQILGKVGTDIQDAKCSWVFCRALELSSDEQRENLFSNYGQDDPACIERVKQIYRDLELPHHWQVYETAVTADLQSEIAAVPDKSLRELLTFLFDKCNRRQK